VSAREIRAGAHRPDFILLFSILGLILVGTVIISSASVVMSQQVAGSPNFYFIRHLWSLLFGAVLFAVGYKIDYSFWKKLAPILIIVSIAMLVLVPGVGSKLGGARRWIHVGPLFFAPTEVFKLAFIIYLAAWFDRKGADVKSFLYSAVPFLVILATVAGLIIAQPDMGTMIVVASVAAIMYFVAGASISHIVMMAGIGVAAIIFLIKTASYRMARFMIFLNPSADQSEKGYQINQALLAVGTGGFLGQGFGQSRQKFNYLPEAVTDSVFAITAEELGFVRSSLIIVGFVFLAMRGYMVAEKAPDTFSRLLAVGITSWIVVQALINVAAMLSIIPLTGVPLPFISYGSSSTVALLLASGILLNISKHTQGETRESRINRRRNWWTYLAGSSRN